MRGIFADRTAKLFSERALISPGRIGRAHQIAPRFDSAFFFECHDHTWSAGHELGQPCEKRTLAMYGVETFRLLSRHVDQLQSADPETVIENFLNDRSRVTRAHCVGFDDAEG